jgi:2,3-dihydroxybenzoate decarboxylase
MYADHSELFGPVWSWGVETATHAMRLVTAGVFERHPKARLILGHMGEAIPFQLWRIDGRYKIANRSGKPALPKPPSHYVRENILVTTSGVCSAEPLACALSALGDDRVMFGADYPSRTPVSRRISWTRCRSATPCAARSLTAPPRPCSDSMQRILPERSRRNGKE